MLVRRSREQLELEIGNFHVIELEGTIIGCAALYPWSREKLAEVGALRQPVARRSRRFNRMLCYVSHIIVVFR